MDRPEADNYEDVSKSNLFEGLRKMSDSEQNIKMSEDISLTVHPKCSELRSAFDSADLVGNLSLSQVCKILPASFFYA